MKQLGKKNDIQDGTLVAFACPCDCTSVCNVSSCTTCSTEGALVSLQAVNKGRAQNYGGNSVLNMMRSGA